MENANKKIIVKAMIMMLIALLAVQASAFDRHNKEPAQHYYVKANKNANLYASDKKTIILTVGKDDFFAVFNIDKSNIWMTRM